MLASVNSIPSAVPIRAPACGTRSIGAEVRFAYPDLMRLFETDSLEGCQKAHIVARKEIEEQTEFQQ